MSSARVAVAIGLGLLLAGCASGIRPEVLARWVGRPAAALEQEWGPPTREVPDGDNRILIYEEVERRSSQRGGFEEQDPSNSRYAGAYERAARAAEEAYHAPRVYVRSYLFWVKPDGTIAHTAVRTP